MSVSLSPIVDPPRLSIASLGTAFMTSGTGRGLSHHPASALGGLHPSYDQECEGDRHCQAVLLVGSQASVGFGMLFLSCFPMVKWVVQKTQSVFRYSLASILISEFDSNDFLLTLIIKLPLAGSEEMPYQSSKLLSWGGQWEGKQHLISWEPS